MQAPLVKNTLPSEHKTMDSDKCYFATGIDVFSQAGMIGEI